MTIYYVNPLNGDDDNDGLSLSAPFLTKTKANSTIATGDTVLLIASATDTENATITITVKSTWRGVNTSGINDGTYYIINPSSAIPTFINSLQSVPVVFENIDFASTTTPLSVSTASSNMIFGLVHCKKISTTNYLITHTGGSYGFDAWLINCDIRNCTTAIFRGIANRISPFHLINSKFYSCSAFLELGTGQSFTSIRGCIFYNTIIGRSNYYQLRLINNIFINSQIILGDRAASVGYSWLIYNNVFTNCTATTGAVYWYDNNVIEPILFDYNLFYNNTLNHNDTVNSYGSHNIAGQNPNYTDLSGEDFSFSSSSPLYRAGLYGDDIGATIHTESSGGVGGNSIFGGVLIK